MAARTPRRKCPRISMSCGSAVLCVILIGHRGSLRVSVSQMEKEDEGGQGGGKRDLSEDAGRRDGEGKERNLTG